MSIRITEIKHFVENEWIGKKINEISNESGQGFFNHGVYKIFSEDGQIFALKGYGDKRDLVLFTNRVSLLLLENGFEGVPKPEKTKSGQYYSQKDSNYYTLTNWIEGTSLSAVKFNERHNMLRLAANSLGRFHSLSDNFIHLIDDPIIDFKMGELWVPEMIERYHLVKESAQHQISSPFRDQIIKLSDDLDGFIKYFSRNTYVEAIDNALTKGIIHGDLETQHIIFSEGSRCSFIDFDRMRIGRKLDDVSRLLNHALSSRILVNKILESYLSAQKLSKDDLAILPVYTQYSNIRRLYWVLNELVANPEIFNNGVIDVRKEIADGQSIISKKQFPGNKITEY